MAIDELIEIAKVTMIDWQDDSEAEKTIRDLYADGYSEQEIEKVLYLMDDGCSLDEAKQILNEG